MPLEGLRRRIRRLTAPLPMDEFPDYDAYWRARGGLGLVVRRWQIAAEIIEPGSTVLDVGCGSGEFLRYLRSASPTVQATGCDVSVVAVDGLRKDGFDALQIDLRVEDIPDQFDYVTCLEVLEHIPDAEAAIRRLKASFRKQLIISIPNIGYFEHRVRLGLFGRFPNTSCIFHVNEHVRHWTPRDFREWVDHFGLKVVRLEGQQGMRVAPWKRFPALWAEQVVFVLEHADQ